MSGKRAYLWIVLVTLFVSVAPFPAVAGEDTSPAGPWLPDLSGPAPASAAEPSATVSPLRTSAKPAAVTVFSGVLEGQGALSADAATGTKDSDVVLSPQDVEGEVTRNDEEPEVEELDGEYFANAPEEIDKGKDGSYAGLTGRIEKFIRYFQNKGRARFETWLCRSGKYSDMMRGILAEYGLPGDLVYVALIESGFSPRAYSVARAAGPWQFIAGTARKYGLRVDWWTDERRDYEKSTRAAAAYLKDLYSMFESWSLATAAYNAGEGKIMRAVSRYKTEDFAKLIRYRYLSRETKDYVPKMLAALTIAKNPGKYGFENLEYDDPLVFDRVSVPGGTDLAALGRIVGVHPDSLHELNPQLRRFCTPPNDNQYVIRVPKGFGLIAAERMEEIRTDAKVTFLRHKVGRRESLASISKRYGTSVAALMEINGLRRPSLRWIRRLVIPVTGLSPESSVPGKEISPAELKLAHMRFAEGYRQGQRVRVRRGQTLSQIARRARVPVAELMRANGIRDPRRVRAGSVIRIPGTRSVVGRGERVRVRRGETLSQIARRARVSVAELMRANGIRDPRRVPAGAAIRIPGAHSAVRQDEARSADGKYVRHVVRDGDTLWSIANAYGLSVRELAVQNHMTTRDPLRKGRVLLIPTES